MKAKTEIRRWCGIGREEKYSENWIGQLKLKRKIM